MTEPQKAQYESEFELYFDIFKREPFKSSLTHWLDTGRMSGSFREAVHKLLKHADTVATNRTLDSVIKIVTKHQGVNDIANESYSLLQPIIEELKNMRK